MKMPIFLIGLFTLVYKEKIILILELMSNNTYITNYSFFFQQMFSMHSVYVRAYAGIYQGVKQSRNTGLEELTFYFIILKLFSSSTEI